MIEGARWRTWVFYNIPLILFVIGLLFPFYWMIVTSFRPDSELYRPWNAANYTPFWTLQSDSCSRPRAVDRDVVHDVVDEHDDYRRSRRP